ncbi:MAG: radical SAM protein [Pseudonocardiaceae bacterium]
MKRTYAADGHLVHDPATGLTHHAPNPLPAGRVRWEQTEVSGWPVVAPAELGRVMPVSVCWSPIVRCNLHCPHCLDDTSVPELNKTDRGRIAGVLAAAGVLGVDISGGEPLLLRELPALAQRIAAAGHTVVSVTTNGWHLARRVEDLAQTVDAIRVSLDGADAASHDRLRGAGSFARAQDGIRTAVSAGIPLQIQMVLMASNHTATQQLVDLATDLGAGGVSFLQMLPLGAGRQRPEEMLSDVAAARLLSGLQVSDRLRVRLRARTAAGGFTVVRADGRVWRNDHAALRIDGVRPLTTATDLALTTQDGSA